MSMTINSMASNNLQKNMMQIATAKRINTAADDAAGLAISKKIEAQVRGLEQGSRNTADMNNLISTAEGAASIVSETLQRARELTVQAQNGTLNDSDRAIIQNEVNGLLQTAGSIAKNTEFNGQQLLTGTFEDKNTASSPNGTGQQISIADLTLQGLDLEDFSVTSKNSIAQLDVAINTLSSSRASMGASMNTLTHTMNSNSIAQLNLAAANSRIVDVDIARAASEKEKNQLIEQYNISMQNRRMEEERNKPFSIFNK